MCKICEYVKNYSNTLFSKHPGTVQVFFHSSRAAGSMQAILVQRAKSGTICDKNLYSAG